MKNKLNLKEKSKNELLKLLTEAEKELLKLKMDLRMGKLKDTCLPRKKRQEIAKIKTIIKEKQN